MSGKKRKGKDPGQNLIDDYADTIKNCDLPLENMKKMLQEKPHFCEKKLEIIPRAVEELKKNILRILQLLTDSSEKEEVDAANKLICAVCSFLTISLSYRGIPDLAESRHLVGVLTNLLNSQDIVPKLKNQISLLGEKFIQSSIFDEHAKVGLNVLSFLLQLAKESSKKVVFKRIWTLRDLINHADFRQSDWAPVYSELIKCVTNPSYLRCREGQHVVGYIMKRNASFTRMVHDIVLRELARKEKVPASGYSSAYQVAWYLADEDTREVLEECIQDIMKRVLHYPRSGLSLQPEGSNAYTMVSGLHRLRKEQKFSRMITNLYAPILWRLLNDSDPWLRCNAAQIFFDSFPLESVQNYNNDFLERQMNIMKDLLNDESHFVRIISIKGFCASFLSTFEVFSVLHTKMMFQVLLDLALDGSTHLVRKAILEGFTLLLKGNGKGDEVSPVINLLEGILPHTCHMFFDDNEKVRKQFAVMLLHVQENAPHFRLRYWSVIKLCQIIKKMENEGPNTGEVLATLVIEDVLQKGARVDMLINRLCKMAEWSFRGLENIFKYAHKAKKMNGADAFRLIIFLIGTARKTLQDYLNSQKNDSSSNQRKTLAPKNLNSKQNLGSIAEEGSEEKSVKEADANSSVSSVVSSVQPEQEEFRLLKKLDKLTAMFQMSTVLWSLFRNDFGEKLSDLYNLASNAIPLFLFHYKGTPVYYATVNFASLIPISKLRPVSTIGSACLSELREANESYDIFKLNCLIYALCAWNLGQDILELCTEWINYAFKEQDLNNTAMNKASGQKLAKVRFQQNSGKPLMALKLLDVLTSDVLNESRLATKNYVQLYEFYLFLKRVLIIIERKLKGDKSFDKPNSVLTDEFLVRTFRRYLRLMHTLDQSKEVLHAQQGNEIPVFAAVEASLESIVWATETLYPRLDREARRSSEREEDEEEVKRPLAVDCCLAVLEEATYAVRLGETHQEHCLALSLFLKDLLSIETPWFLGKILQTIKALAEYAEAYTDNDEWFLLQQVLPSLLEGVLKVLVNLDIPANDIKKNFKDISSLKTSLFCLPNMELKNNGESQTFKEMFKNLLNCAILIIAREINYEDEVVKHKHFEGLPWFAAIILKQMILKMSYVKHLLPVLMDFTREFINNKEGHKVLSCLSILYTITKAASKRFKPLQLEGAIQTVYPLISNYQNRETNMSQHDTSDFSGEDEMVLDVKKSGEATLRELATTLNCALVRQNEGSTSGECEARASECESPVKACSSPTPQPSLSVSKVEPQSPVRSHSSLSHSSRVSSRSVKSVRSVSSSKSRSRRGVRRSLDSSSTEPSPSTSFESTPGPSVGSPASIADPHSAPPVSSSSPSSSSSPQSPSSVLTETPQKKKPKLRKKPKK